MSAPDSGSFFPPLRRKGIPDGDTALAIADLSAEQLRARMGDDLALRAYALYDWIIRRGRTPDLAVDIIMGIAEGLVGLGLPLHRYGSALEMLDTHHDAIGRVWLAGEGVTEQVYIRSEEDTRYLNSPYYYAAQTKRWLELWLPDTDDQLFGIVPQLKAEGYTHYLCVPTWLINGSKSWLTFATKDPKGFSPVHVAVLAFIVPAIAMLIDMRATWLALDKLLRTYVGDEPHQAILRGNTKRGQVSTIRSAMLFADMRDSVGHTSDLTAIEAVGVFNDLFDCLVPPIETRRGEVLKYIGDGLLAIFREGSLGAHDAAERALGAAQEGLVRLKERNLTHPDERPIRVGIALHFGEAAYGNVGSGVRLDFTVIGRDVGLASRMASMNRRLNEPLIMSGAFTRRLGRPAIRLGAFEARGIREPIEIFRPEQTEGPDVG